MVSVCNATNSRRLLRKLLSGQYISARQYLDSGTVSTSESHVPSVEHKSQQMIIQEKYENLFLPEMNNNSMILREPDQPKNPKTLRVSVLGMPNAGKSTLINSILGRRVLATSSKIDTTTQNILAVKTVGDTQILFQDTPGMMSMKKSKRHRVSSGVHLPRDSFFESDLGLIIGDLTSRRLKDGFLQPEVLLTMLKNRHVPTVLVLNKVDKYKRKEHLLVLIHLLTAGHVGGVAYKPEKQKLVPMRLPKVKEEAIAEYETMDLTDEDEVEHWMGKNELRILNKLRHCRGWPHFQDVFVVSSKKGFGIKNLSRYMLSYAKPGPWKYHSEVNTDASPTQVILDAVRASMLENLPQEIPYKIAPRISDWQETEDGRLIVDIEIVCGKRGHFHVLSNRCSTVARETQEQIQDTFFVEAFVRVSPIYVQNLKL